MAKIGLNGHILSGGEGKGREGRKKEGND